MLPAKAARKITTIRRNTPHILMDYILRNIYNAANSMKYSYTWKNYHEYEGYNDVLDYLEYLGYKLTENVDKNYIIIEWN